MLLGIYDQRVVDSDLHGISIEKRSPFDQMYKTNEAFKLRGLLQKSDGL